MLVEDRANTHFADFMFSPSGCCISRKSPRPPVRCIIFPVAAAAAAAAAAAEQGAPPATFVGLWVVPNRFAGSVGLLGPLVAIQSRKVTRVRESSCGHMCVSSHQTSSW